MSDADPGFPDSIFGDFKAPDDRLPDSDFSTAPSDQSFDERGRERADAGFSDASFPETPAPVGGEHALGRGYGTYPSAQPFDPSQHAMEHYQGYQPQGYQPQGYHPQGYEPQGYEPQGYPQYSAPQAPHPQPPQAPHGETGRQLQAFDSVYDQPPQIALGGGQSPAHFFEADRGDADFFDESQLAGEASKGSKLMNSLKGRSAVMIASALLGAIALGGALAYAYKQSGGSGETPVVAADASPVKEAPEQPGGKEFPHKNKLIYDRLTNGDQPGAERLVPRQEDVAVPALPLTGATSGLPAAVATTDDPAGQAAADGARKVNTFVVRPDGSVETQPADAAAAAAAVQGAQDAAAAAGQAAQSAADAATQAATGAASQALGQPSNMMPVPAPQAAPQAAPQQMATADPAAAAPAEDSKFIVQLGSTKSQTDALANFADAQQKYPSLLGSYQPVIRKTDLGDKGTWYRLQVGPMDDKTAAYKLCGQLKAQGHSDCLVMAQ